jgi:hypothetical protein
LHAIFHRLSVHRGIWHSILAGVFCAAATAIIFKSLLERHEGVAWLAGGFLFVGYLVHLILDELYSVDVMDTRIKSSFGTALKLIDTRHPIASASMAVAAALAVWAAPATKTFTEGISSRDMWTGLNQRLLPQETWFGIIDKQGRLALDRHGIPQDASPITTGALPDKPVTPPTPSEQQAP